MDISLPWCSTRIRVDINTGHVTKGCTEEQNREAKLEIFKNTPYSSDELYRSLGDLQHDVRRELMWAIDQEDKQWDGREVLLNMVFHLPDEADTWPEWMQDIYVKVTDTIMSYSPTARDWLQQNRLAVMEGKLRSLWSAVAQYEKNRRIFDCTSKGATEEQAHRECREMRDHAKSAVQTIVNEVKHQLTRRGKENLERITREWQERNRVTQENQEHQQHAAGEEVPMDTDAGTPVPSFFLFPEGARTEWKRQFARAKRAMQTRWGAEMISEDDASEEEEEQTHTQKAADQNDDMPMAGSVGDQGDTGGGRPPKRRASEPMNIDKFKKQKNDATKVYTCSRCHQRIMSNQLEAFGTPPKKYACMDKAACASRKEKHEDNKNRKMKGVQA